VVRVRCADISRKAELLDDDPPVCGMKVKASIIGTARSASPAPC
jgi:hypothetical protein